MDKAQLRKEFLEAFSEDVNGDGLYLTLMNDDPEDIVDWWLEALSAQRKSDLAELEKELLRLNAIFPKEGFDDTDYAPYNKALSDISSIIKRIMEK